jgi:hypothetical protein
VGRGLCFRRSVDQSIECLLASRLRLEQDVCKLHEGTAVPDRTRSDGWAGEREKRGDCPHPLE